jgi:hypothetical protein
VVKTLWFCGLLSLLALVAYSEVSITLGNGGALSAARASPSESVPLPSLTAAPGLTNNDDNAAINLSAYLFLHATRNASDIHKIGTRTAACP